MTVEQSLIQTWANMFYKSGETIIPALVNCAVPRKVIMSQYPKVTQIEDLEPKEKSELKQYVISMFPGKTVDELMEAAKVVHTFGSLIS